MGGRRVGADAGGLAHDALAPGPQRREARPLRRLRREQGGGPARFAGRDGPAGSTRAGPQVEWIVDRAAAGEEAA